VPIRWAAHLPEDPSAACLHLLGASCPAQRGRISRRHLSLASSRSETEWAPDRVDRQQGICGRGDPLPRHQLEVLAAAFIAVLSAAFVTSMPSVVVTPSIAPPVISKVRSQACGAVRW
jgi:hypothetical protein